jgi:hypothetical protein
MKLNEFIEKFLPDYEQRKIKDIPHTNRKNYGVLCAIWERNNFPEALQNFANKICEKQREICSFVGYELQEATREDIDEFFCFVALDLQGTVNNCEQPKIDDL